EGATSAVEVLDELFDFYRNELRRTEFRAGCPVVAVAVEAGDPDKPEQTPPVIERAAAACERWRQIIARRLAGDGVAEPDAAALATLVLSSFEGAIVVARACRDVTPLDQVQAQ
ncbi:TetR family transcriptional regulator, partial [Enterococcus faecium]